MARYIEVVAAALSSMIALLWLVYVVHLAQGVNSLIGAEGKPIFPLNMGLLSLIFLGTTLLIFGLSLGAYLHILHRRHAGLVLLWICAALLILDMAYYDFAQWNVIPTAWPFSPTALVGPTLPLILPVLEVLATSSAVIAVLASLAPRVSELGASQAAPAPDSI